MAWPFPVVGVGTEFTYRGGRCSHHTHIGVHLLGEHVVAVASVERFDNNGRAGVVFQELFAYAFLGQGVEKLGVEIFHLYAAGIFFQLRFDVVGYLFDFVDERYRESRIG